MNRFPTPLDGAATGSPLALLRVEGAALFAAAVAGYAQTGAGWGLFAALILSPDVAMLGYLAGPRIGAALYNAAHTTLAPILLGALAWATGMPLVVALALIWAAHVGMDRMMGYGLKYPTAFGDTHLGRKGRAPRAAQPA